VPLELQVDVAARRVHIEASGVVTVEEILRILDAIVAHPDFEPGMPQLLDLTGAEDADVDSDRLRRVVSAAERLLPKLRPTRLALVARKPVLFGVSRMYEALADVLPVPVRVFTDLDAARAWLESDPDPA